jgi:predicted nucleotidyltransferase component of viral defense system
VINEQALKDKIKNIARERGIHISVCWKQFLLERFLARLAGSKYFDHFIFKGGFLLSYLLKLGRETTDLDFLLKDMKVEQKGVQNTIEQIIAVHSVDEIVFSFDSIQVLHQPHMHYPGYRIGLDAAFGRIKNKIQIDIGIGDVVQPLNHQISLIHYRGKPFFESAISLLVYPVETIFSEKLETILSKGMSNSRMKDYHDLILLIRNQKMLKSDELKKAIEGTFSNRGTALRLIEFDEHSLQSIQKFWTFHLRGLGNSIDELQLPQEILTVIKEINNYISHMETLVRV